MPVIDGFEVIKSIRSNPKNQVPIIVMSGVDDGERIIEVFDLKV